MREYKEEFNYKLAFVPTLRKALVESIAIIVSFLLIKVYSAIKSFITIKRVIAIVISKPATQISLLSKFNNISSIASQVATAIS